MNIIKNRFEGKLKNGIRVILYFRKDFPITTDAIIHSGSKFDPKESLGLSHFIEHIIVNGSKKFLTKDLLAEHIESVGGFFGAMTSQDTLVVRTEIPDKADYGRVVDIFEATLCEPLLDKENFENEKKVVVKEIKISQSNPSKILINVGRELFFKGTPFEHSVLGNIDSILGLDYEKVVSEQKKLLGKERITFVASGDISIEELLSHLNKLDFINGQKDILNNEEYDSVTETKKLGFFLDIPQTYICFGVLAPDYFSRDMIYLGLLGDILAGGRSSRLTKRLRYDKGLVYGIGFNRIGGAKKGFFGFFTSTEYEKVQDVVDEIILEIKDIREKGIKSSELEFVKDKRIKSLKISMQTSNSWVNFHGSSEVFTGGSYDIDSYINTIQSTTIDDIKNIIDKYFSDEKWKMAICGKTKAEDIKIKF